MGLRRTISTKRSGVVRCELVLESRIIRNNGVKKASWKISSGAT